MIKKFSDFNSQTINESFKVDVSEPYSLKDEKDAAKKIKITLPPVVVTDVNGEIDDDRTVVSIDFSDGAKLFYGYSSMNKLTRLILYKNNTEISLDKYTDTYFGSTGTVIGDMGLIYRDFMLGKIS